VPQAGEQKRGAAPRPTFTNGLAQDGDAQIPAGAACRSAGASRSGDEMSGPALLLLGFAVTGRPSTGAALLAALTVAAAVGGPLFGALLDRSSRPDRVLALTLAAYVLGVIAIATAVGRLPVPLMVVIALAAGLFNPAVAGGWTAQLPPHRDRVRADGRGRGRPGRPRTGRWPRGSPPSSPGARSCGPR
jgi:hypothetical protein